MKLYADIIYRKAHYDDHQFRSLMHVYSLALTLHGKLPPRRALEAMLGADEVAFLLIEGDLEEADGVLQVHRWNDYQQRDVTAAERQRRHRANVMSQPVTRDDTVTVTIRPSSSSSSSSTTPRTENESSKARETENEPDPLDTVWQLTGRYPSGKVRVWVDGLTETYGEANVIKALAEAYAIEPVKFIGHAEDLLKRGAVKAEQAERDRKAREKTEAQRRPRSEPTPIGGWDVDGVEYDAIQAELKAKREAQVGKH